MKEKIKIIEEFIKEEEEKMRFGEDLEIELKKGDLIKI